MLFRSSFSVQTPARADVPVLLQSTSSESLYRVDLSLNSSATLSTSAPHPASRRSSSPLSSASPPRFSHCTQRTNRLSRPFSMFLRRPRGSARGELARTSSQRAGAGSFVAGVKVFAERRWRRSVRSCQACEAPQANKRSSPSAYLSFPLLEPGSTCLTSRTVCEFVETSRLLFSP